MPNWANLKGDSLRHFFRMWRRIERKEPTAVVRQADGEEALMRGHGVSEMATVATAAHPDLRFVFVRHPNPATESFREILRRVPIIDPLPYEEMVRQLAACRLIVTDSGGFQEEGSFLGKRLIVCRRATERPEALGAHSALCREPAELASLFAAANADPVVTAPCPFGDGHAAPRVVALLEELLRA